MTRFKKIVNKLLSLAFFITFVCLWCKDVFLNLDNGTKDELDRKSEIYPPDQMRPCIKVGGISINQLSFFFHYDYAKQKMCNPYFICGMGKWMSFCNPELLLQVFYTKNLMLESKSFYRNC